MSANNSGNTFTGGISVEQGTLQIASINNAATNGVLGNNTSIGLGTISQTATLEYTGSTALSNMPFTLAGAGSGAFQIDSAATNLTLTGAIGGNGTLVKSGSGTLTLGGNNTFTGGVTINAGTLLLGSAGALNSTAANAVAFGPSSTGVLGLNGLSVTVSGLNTDPMTGTPVVQDGNLAGAILTVNNATANTFAGVLRDGPGGGALSLIKSGAGTLTLSGSNNFTGATTVAGGTLNTADSGTLATGALTISTTNGVASVVNLGDNQTVSSLSGTLGGNVPTLSIASGVTLTDNQSSGNTLFPGLLIINSSGAFIKSGSSSLELNGAPTLNANGGLQVNGGTMRFNIFIGGEATVGAGVRATVSSGATLELAGSVSALSSGANRVNITNSSSSPGLLVSGTHQQVGNIDGSGTTQVNAGSDLTANHIVQSALVIGGAAGSPALVTIDASDASGNPLASRVDLPWLAR